MTQLRASSGLTLSRWLGSTALALAISLGAADAWAESCNGEEGCGWLQCGWPASGVPEPLWGELRPTDVGQLPANRDTTDYDTWGVWNASHPWFKSLDVENGWIFMAYSNGLMMFDGRDDPADLLRRGSAGRFSHDIPCLETGVCGVHPHIFEAVTDVDAPPGVDEVAAMSVKSGMGIIIWNTTDKPGFFAAYQDHGSGKRGMQVYATTVGGRHYAFLGTTYEGVLVYDMSAALSYTECVESAPEQINCPGVYLGRLGTLSATPFVDGADGYVAVASGVAHGVEIWDVSSLPALPTSPVLEAHGPVVAEFGVALWSGSRGGPYLGVWAGMETHNVPQIHDVSCVGTSSCGADALDEPLWASAPVPLGLTAGNLTFVTFSRSGDVPFLYFGSGNGCAGSEQREWLYDVSDPANPRDVTPGPGTIDGQTVGYWGWYYRGNPTGFNYVAPRVGKFYGDHFYRAADAIFDVHLWTPPPPEVGAGGSGSGGEGGVGPVGVGEVAGTEPATTGADHEHDAAGGGCSLGGRSGSGQPRGTLWLLGLVGVGWRWRRRLTQSPAQRKPSAWKRKVGANL